MGDLIYEKFHITPPFICVKKPNSLEEVEVRGGNEDVAFRPSGLSGNLPWSDESCFESLLKFYTWRRCIHKKTTKKDWHLCHI